MIGKLLRGATAKLALSQLAVWPRALDLLALAALLCAALAAPLTLTLTLMVITIGMLAGGYIAGLRSRSEAARLLRTQPTTTLLLIAAATTVAAQRGVLGAVALTFLIATALLLLSASAVERLDALAIPYATHVPGMRTRHRPWFDISFPLVAGLWALLLLTVTIAVMEPGCVVNNAACLPEPGFAIIAALTISLAAAAALTLAAAYDAFQRIALRYRGDKQLVAALNKLAPEFMVHWHAPENTVYQLGMWLPYLEQVGANFVIVVRDGANFAEVAAITDRPVLLRRALDELDPVMVPSLRAVFYVNAATRNAHLIRYTNLTHIQLNHGDSDKAPSINPAFRMFDRNFVAGQAAVDRFAVHGVPTRPDFFRIVGRPQVADITVASGPVPAAPTVLYAPTWSGFYEDTNYSSLPVGAEIVGELLVRGATVVFRPHPLANRSTKTAAAADQIRAMLAADREKTGRAHVFGAAAETDFSIVDCFNAADVMISDVSSVIGDFLYSEKPFVMVNMLAAADDFATEFPMSRGAYVLHGVGGRLQNLASVLDDSLGADPLGQVRRELKTYYLGAAHPGGPVTAFVEAVRDELRLRGSKNSYDVPQTALHCAPSAVPETVAGSRGGGEDGDRDRT